MQTLASKNLSNGFVRCGVFQFWQRMMQKDTNIWMHIKQHHNGSKIHKIILWLQMYNLDKMHFLYLDAKYNFVLYKIY